MSMDNNTITAIRHTLQDLRQEALTRFVSDLIPLLRQEGYTYEDLLIALTNWTDQQLGFQKAVKHLEEAASAVHEVYKR